MRSLKSKGNKMQRKISILVPIILLLMSTVSMAADKTVTLKEKIGQMLMIGFKGSELKPNDEIVKIILAQQIGGVVLFDYDVQTRTYNHNIKNPQQLKKLTKELQSYAKQAALKRHNRLYPLFVSVDYEGGKVNRLKENYGFPKTLSAAEVAKISRHEAERYARTMAETLQKAGVNLNYAPVLDVNVNQDNPVIGKLGRSFSSNPNVVADYGALFAKAYQEHGILCAYKHFPGHGSSTSDSHQGFVDVTKTWKKSELRPYKKLFNQSYSCPAVMSAHVVHYGLDKQGYPASISKAITMKLLRDDLKFDGVVITDDLQMKAISDNYGTAEAVRLAINAGADILMFGNQLVSDLQDPQKIINVIYADVQNGKIPESRINEAYQRIMKLKAKIGNANPS